MLWGNSKGEDTKKGVLGTGKGVLWQDGTKKSAVLLLNRVFRVYSVYSVVIPYELIDQVLAKRALR